MAYSLVTSYQGDSLISGFNFYDGPDLSNGFVAYQNQSSAQQMGLYSVDAVTGVVTLGVDHTNNITMGSGRPSLRLESIETYEHGLFLADFLHMPPSQCGLWPAFWMYGPDWPSNGELDIIEGANNMHNNIISAHTTNGCDLDSSLTGLYTGTMDTSTCGIGTENIGCGFSPPSSDTTSYGDGFNAVGGGVYAVEWDSNHIRVWHFPRTSIPSDILAKQPNPSGWGLPEAIFGCPSCNVNSYWNNMRFVINTDFCGDYGNPTWEPDGCTAFASSCQDFVANNPTAFTSAYWAVNYIDAYQISNTTTGSSGTTTNTTGIWNGTSTTTMTSTTTVTRTVADASGSLSSPSVSTTSPTNPLKIGDFSYLGCFSSLSNFDTFRLVDTTSSMTLELCVSNCANEKYAGVFENSCYCASTIDPATQAQSSSVCNAPCPGNAAEYCGGLTAAAGNSTINPLSRRHLRRATLTGNLLTVYGDVSSETAPVPPAIIPGPTSGTSSGGGGVVVTTMTYLTVHPSSPGQLMQQTFTTTVTTCGCAADKTREFIPVMTTIASCQACGAQGENSVTLTVPCQASATGQAGYETMIVAPATAETTCASNEVQAGVAQSATSVLAMPASTTGTTETYSTALPLMASDAPRSWVDVRRGLLLGLAALIVAALVM